MGYNSLEIGKKALIAQRLGLDVTSNNIANVNTPGFSRRDAVMSESGPHLDTGNFVGTGAMVEKMRTFREEFFDREVRTSVSTKSTYESDEQILQRIQAVLSEPSENGIGEMLGEFFNMMEELSLKPESIGIRESVLAQGQTIVDRFHSVAGQLTDAREEVKNSAQQNVKEINGLLRDISKLNGAVLKSKGKAGTSAQTYVDQREKKLEDLSEMLKITVTSNEDGSLNVFTSGINLVTGPVANTLELTENINSAAGERRTALTKIDSNGNAIASFTPKEAEMGSLFKHFNVTLDDKDSSGGFSVFKKVNQLANAFAKKINGLTQTGFGLDDTDAVPPGRNFFAPVVGEVNAKNIEISSDVKDKPRALPLAAAAGEPGNNAIALKIAGLATDRNFLDNSMPSEFYSTFLTNLGNAASEARSGRKSSELVTEQLQQQRESVIGVNIDEEAINLVKFQKSFEAASRVVSVTNQILTTIVNLGR